MAADLSQTNSQSYNMQTLTCRHCGKNQYLPTTPIGSQLICAQCHRTLHQHTPRGIQRTMALSLAALILFIPANTLPILSMSSYGFNNKSTIWKGVVELWKSGTQGIALLVLLCSIIIPLAKIMGLFYLCFSWQTCSSKRNSKLLRFIEIIGRWSMLDVFLVAILVAIVKLGSFASVQPELGLIAFSGVVVLTMFASANFDSRLLWQSRDVL
jgi:paraquat-inducible protein A